MSSKYFSYSGMIKYWVDLGCQSVRKCIESEFCSLGAFESAGNIRKGRKFAIAVKKFLVQLF